MTKTMFAWQVIGFAVALVLLPFWLVFGCPTGTTEYEGLCAADPAPAVDSLQSTINYKPSDEKPHHSQIPEWQDGTVKAELGKVSTEDKEKEDADRAGKKSAHVPQ